MKHAGGIYLSQVRTQQRSIVKKVNTFFAFQYRRKI
jgi:hypothetical protein